MVVTLIAWWSDVEWHKASGCSSESVVHKNLPRAGSGDKARLIGYRNDTGTLHGLPEAATYSAGISPPLSLLSQGKCHCHDTQEFETSI